MATRAGIVLPLLACVALLLATVCVAQDGSLNEWGPWKTGRATNYGADAWSIHDGGCNYGHLSPGEPIGWHVAAMTDVDELYPRGACGYCLEVKCNPSVFKDGYGSWLDRTSACWDLSASRVVRITDTCPCTYAPNQASNKRWCCGDMPHLDLSYITFGSLAAMRWGVIGIQYRQVPCDYVPGKLAYASDYTNQDSSYDPRAPLPLRDWPEYMTNRPSQVTLFGSKGMGPGWVDASWNTYVVPSWQTQSSGIGKTPALCAKISYNGALALYTSNSSVFAGRTKLAFWMYVGVTGYNGLDAKVADITISISGNKGGCGNPRIWYVRPTQFVPTCNYCTDYWWYYEFKMGGFGGGDPNTIMRPYDFQGCGGNGIWDLNKIEFRNDGYGGGGDKYVCLDNISLI